LPSQLIEKDDLVALEGAALRDRTVLHNTVIGVILHAGDEEDAIGIERGEPVVIGEAAIKNHDGAGLEAQGASDPTLVHAACGHDGEAGQQPLMIEQQMQLDGSLGAPVLGPVEDRGAEFNQRGVQAQQLVLKAEAVPAGDRTAAAEQLIEDALVQLPGAVLVGIGQGRALGRVRQPQVPQFAFAGGQATANLAQRLRPAQVAEQHGHKLPPAGKSAGMTLGPILDNGPFKLVPGKQLQHLAENAGYSYHGGGGPPLWLTSSSTQTVAEFYPRRRSQANLDKSDPDQNINADRALGFLRQLLRQVRGNLLVIWDGSGPHLARKVEAFLYCHLRLYLEYFPPYAPELNPVEYAWGYLKQNPLAQHPPTALSGLADSARRSGQSLQRQEKLLSSFLEHSPLFLRLK